KERRSEDPIEELEGPIMAEECDYVCADCETRLFEILNLCTVGKVPWQLKNLSYAEKMLVAKVRRNRCVIRVTSGRGKLSALAIMFANPTVKVYNILPPTKDELSEGLAFVFLGPTKPTQDEFSTPTLKSRLRILQTFLKMGYHVAWNGNRG
ncbi:hypothetical protein B0H14DRAFT_2335499, partial [Mycena olivaceomarginata]